ncbi:ATPase [Nitrosococcus oceani ATCC 19707]|uniref:ATPase n=1 Tax=Nitrosococcus oceani (strain ATCC 19707 / BCRC 17464 / JCM 30415 / NCIMB 11848 / C-107) TaxID=323261 RepID=Q3JDB6_NITOC|nr:P-loop NTPase fold protein [Nitrosococcus oceani]ABA57180.1 ATPase [Nitrosococcus oceani ATCC 19707]GEM21497.1 ATPase [Nitrosococcus oceani]
MWPDNETERDYLNFGGVAETVAEITVQAQGRPISIGVSGAWGVGKSSMIKLIRTALTEKDKSEPARFIYVEFNAWLYQGYDDARAALLEVIATKLNEEAEKRKSGVDKAKELLHRVNWLRAAKLGAGSALALALGLPPTGLIGDVVRVGRKVIGEGAGAEEAQEAADAVSEVITTTEGLIKAKPELSPPREIHAIRECFEQTLAEMGVTLVVLIDDLDRCLPPTTISTLEAIRLFLFLDNTAFVIAADDAMIKHAVRQHFGEVDDDLVINYFDKLIQIPIRVPPLGTQEVRAYMMLLFIETTDIDDTLKEGIREAVCSQLAKSWRGERVDRAFIQSVYKEAPPELVARFDTADRLAPIMVSASQISGNPRLVKRFLNALSIRMAISRAHDVGVDEAVLAKMLLFERCGNPKAYDALIAAVNNDPEGKPVFLAEWEQKATSGAEVELEPLWDDRFIREWLTITPPLADTDLRGVLYVSREHAPLITPEDRLSSEGAELLTAILTSPDMAASLHDRLAVLARPETTVIMDRILEQARREQEWGTPAILDACIAVAKADPSLGTRVAGFLSERPLGQIKPGIVPKISDQQWVAEVFARWKDADVSAPVKKAIEAVEKS